MEEIEPGTVTDGVFVEFPGAETVVVGEGDDGGGESELGAAFTVGDGAVGCAL